MQSAAGGRHRRVAGVVWQRSPEGGNLAMRGGKALMKKPSLPSPLQDTRATRRLVGDTHNSLQAEHSLHKTRSSNYCRLVDANVFISLRKLSKMVCCLLFFDPSPLDYDPRNNYARTWQISMMDSPKLAPAQFAFGFCCLPCAIYMLRVAMLEGDMSRYKCCQDYIFPDSSRRGLENAYGFKGLQGCETKCPEVCLCIEVCSFTSLAVSSSRAYVMDTRNIQPDPCDNRIIRFNNCLQLLSCACSLLSLCLAMCMVDCGDLARLIDILADWVFLCTASCMHAQTDYELNHKPEGFDPWAVPITYLPTVPSKAVMDRRSNDPALLADGSVDGVALQAAHTAQNNAQLDAFNAQTEQNKKDFEAMKAANPGYQAALDAQAAAARGDSLPTAKEKADAAKEQAKAAKADAAANAKADKIAAVTKAKEDKAAAKLKAKEDKDKAKEDKAAAKVKAKADKTNAKTADRSQDEDLARNLYATFDPKNAPKVNLGELPPPQTKMEKLKELAELRAQGILTEAEFNKEKKKVLAQS
jgi:hypothetical protein